MFLKGFENFLSKNDLYLDLSKPRLNGNIKKISTDEYLKDGAMTDLMPKFFKEETENLSPIPGASESLKNLSKKCQIIVLTNISFKEKISRVKALKKNSMNYPDISYLINCFFTNRYFRSFIFKIFRSYFILPSLNSTCLRTTGSYFLTTILSVIVREFFLAT